VQPLPECIVVKSGNGRCQMPDKTNTRNLLGCCASIDEQSAKSTAQTARQKILFRPEPIENPKSKIENRFT
jgi:hypothetical protein